MSNVNSNVDRADVGAPLPIRFDRRRFLVAAAVMGAVGAGAGVAVRELPIDDERGRAEYEEAVRATWRHSDSTDLPWPAAQRELVRYGILAANNHNSQPWRFRLLDRSIGILPEFGPAGPAGDFDGHQLFASLGCAAENMVQAAAAFGYRAIPSYRAATSDIQVDFYAETRRRTVLFDAIPQRQSTAADFDGRPVASEHLRLLEAAGTDDGVKILLLTERRQVDQIVAYMSEATSALIARPSFSSGFPPLMRFTYREALATRDGMFVKPAGLPVLPEAVGRFIFSRPAFLEAFMRTFERQARSSAGIAVFVSERNDRPHWVAAGRCCQRFCLQATALGIRSAFVNPQLDLPDVRGQLASYLGIGRRRPDLVLRFGYGRELPRSLRRPVEQVIVEA